MDLFLLDKLILKIFLNINNETIFKVAVAGMLITYFVTGSKQHKKVRK